MSLHFVGFIDNRYWKQESAYINAVKIFGLPDFIHRVWDMRAYQEVAKGDKVIWHNKSSLDIPPYLSFSFDDSRQDIIFHGGEKEVDYI